MKISNDLGIIRLNNIIPVNKENLRYINFEDIQDAKYKNLLIQQNNFIQLNTQKIKNKANKIYNFVTKDIKEFFVGLCCNFKLLEEKCNQFRKKCRREN